MDEVKVENVETVPNVMSGACVVIGSTIGPVVNPIAEPTVKVKFGKGGNNFGVSAELLKIIDARGPIKAPLLKSMMSEKFPDRNLKKSIPSFLSIFKKQGRVDKTKHGWISMPTPAPATPTP